MHVFPTGTTGFIGEVLGLARDAEKATALARAGVEAHLDGMEMFVGVYDPTSNARTREATGWNPQGPGCSPICAPTGISHERHGAGA